MWGTGTDMQVPVETHTVKYQQTCPKTPDIVTASPMYFVLLSTALREQFWWH